MHPFETIRVDGMIAACNGGGGPLGHPKVYLNLADDGQVECPYCSRLFVHGGHGDGHGVETPSASRAGSARGGDHAPPSAPAPASPGDPRPASPATLGATSSAANPAKP